MATKRRTKKKAAKKRAGKKKAAKATKDRNIPPEQIKPEIISAAATMIREICTRMDGILKRHGRPSSRALLAFFGRTAGAWDSIRIQIESSKSEIEFASRANDCAAVLRCMLDAYYQAAHVMNGDDDPDAMGKLYLDYAPIELKQIMDLILNQKNSAAQKIIYSPLRKKGERRNRAEFEKVELAYRSRKKNGEYKRKKNGEYYYRPHWYCGSLRELACSIGKSDEYEWFILRTNGSVHSGPFAMFKGPLGSAKTLQQIALTTLGRTAMLVVQNDGIDVCDRSRKLMEECEKDILNL